mmetsp:Transcript_1456/g.4909  ORF Transcript_1456/g.4909 Transcript_1456/m.4909 type:complete len:232 (-) Transcript_1456:2088-2783(-)
MSVGTKLGRAARVGLRVEPFHDTAPVRSLPSLSFSPHFLHAPQPRPSASAFSFVRLFHLLAPSPGFAPAPTRLPPPPWLLSPRRLCCRGPTPWPPKAPSRFFSFLTASESPGSTPPCFSIEAVPFELCASRKRASCSVSSLRCAAATISLAMLFPVERTLSLATCERTRFAAAGLRFACAAVIPPCDSRLRCPPFTSGRTACIVRRSDASTTASKLGRASPSVASAASICG